MARWDNRRRSDNVERRAGQAVGAGAIFMLIRFIFSKFGIVGVAVVVAGYFGLKQIGIDPLQLLAGGSPTQSTEVGDGQYDDEILAVVASTEDIWARVFREEGLNGGIYPAPKVVIFSGAVSTACGTAPSSVGPFYCPGDRKVYFDTIFFKELETRFNAGGDFPRAYVIAHEVGHHVQTVVGISDQVRSAQGRMGQSESNQMQVRMELQADCLAGLWANGERRQALEPGDIEEALTAAAAIGDDTLQRRSGGTIKPETFTHGTSEQRKRWFYRGFDAGSFGACDTFQVPYSQL
ncbi:KPN_02809 family neutral zinc metallopeptidase [Parvularcula marina]|uniref:Neutral zinc metallopeptidase n=1 Tax=Parvularcula marina TaxID=2292771 RepID=A0A371RIQ3_9PROT|nr:neutral zinc metallopeptidase [Parvularcula marina]RFB05318.1 neutral zinc metallopeptidase [Parvularcula marina]